MATTTIKQGDTFPALTASLASASGAPVDLTTATSVTLVMRSQSGVAPKVSATATVINASTGAVSYSWTTQDTNTAGRYDVEWLVAWGSGAVQRYPIQGYQSVSIEENLTTAGGARLVSLEEIRDHLRMPSGDRQFDARLLRLLDSITPVIENVTGPILQRVYQNETYDGGNYFITLRHRPLVEVHSVVEYRGPIAYTLTQVPSPDLGTIYSYEFEPTGRIVRRTVGGGITAFPPGMATVFVTYTAGQAVVPGNVREATLRMIDLHFKKDVGGNPSFSGNAGAMDDDLPKGPPIGFFMPGVVRELLVPNRRHPSVA